ncbi:MAG TPA: hypothetical protein VHE59_02090 [Mucilaginibacter sp.]|nr:hypothetical protein [Mucilaginibacter sp.]
MKRLHCIYSIVLLLTAATAQAQIDSSLLKGSAKTDTTRKKLNMDAIYDRPFLKMGKMPVSIGGYMEANWQYVSTSGISIGNQFQFRRFSLFAASSISNRVKFLSEIEYEDDPTGDPDEATEGGKFEVEYAAVDIELHPLLNLRGGMIVNPIGSFNENHDGPKWEFTDRPIAMTQMLPDTWSNPGFGAYGKEYSGHWMYGYEFYLSGGFNDSIIDNPQGRTSLPAAKTSASRFTKSAGGEPLYTAKVSIGNDKIGELGLSYMGGVYNIWQIEGATVDNKRRVNVFDVDFNTTLPWTHTNVITEWAYIALDIPPNYPQSYGNRQFGGFLDVVQPVITGRMLGWQHATLNLAVRGEYVDWNVGNFAAIGTPMYNDVWSIMPAVSFRPTPQTVLRLNYRIQNQRDITGSTIGATIGPTRGVSFGVSTYF